MWSRTQEEDDECISCNIGTIAIEPAFQGLVYWPDNDTHLLPCRGHIVKTSILVFHAPDQKRSEETPQTVPSKPRKGIHMLQPSLLSLKRVNTVLWEQVWLLSAMTLPCHWTMSKEEKRCYILHSRSKHQEDKTELKGCVNKRKRHPSIKSP